ncbi:MAG: hypothetical protein ABJA57_09025 [Ginsengibacter sp.]
MNFLSQQLKPFASLLSFEPMPKKEFVILAHRNALSNQLNLVRLVEMIQFSTAYRKDNQIVFE